MEQFKWTPTLRCTLESNYWGGDADIDHTQTIGGYSQIIGGKYSPIPPGFGTPECHIVISFLSELGKPFLG